MIQLACVCWLWSAVMAAETGTPAEQYEAVKQSHPKLAELCHQAGAELDEIALRDYAVPDRARRREMHDWSKRKVDSDDAELIAGAIEEAYANQPRNWAVLAVGFGAARRGVVDNRVLPIARDLVSSAARLPDDAMMAVGAALPILALSDAREDVNLLVKATSRTYVGVETKNVDFVSSHRNCCVRERCRRCICTRRSTKAYRD